jgi:hypothetical protein
MRELSDGRIRRTESEWRAIVSRFESSGLSEAGFCRKANVSRKSFRDSRKRLSRSEPMPRILATRRTRSTPAAFVEWLAPSTDATPTAVGARGERVEFELALPGGVVVRWRA